MLINTVTFRYCSTTHANTKVRSNYRYFRHQFPGRISSHVQNLSESLTPGHLGESLSIIRGQTPFFHETSNGSRSKSRGKNLFDEPKAKLETHIGKSGNAIE